MLYFSRILGLFFMSILNLETKAQWLYDLETRILYNLLNAEVKESKCEKIIEYLRI